MMSMIKTDLFQRQRRDSLEKWKKRTSRHRKWGTHHSCHFCSVVATFQRRMWRRLSRLTGRLSEKYCRRTWRDVSIFLACLVLLLAHYFCADGHTDGHTAVCGRKRFSSFRLPTPISLTQRSLLSSSSSSLDIRDILSSIVRRHHSKQIHETPRICYVCVFAVVKNALWIRRSIKGDDDEMASEIHRLLVSLNKS